MLCICLRLGLGGNKTRFKLIFKAFHRQTTDYFSLIIVQACPGRQKIPLTLKQISGKSSSLKKTLAKMIF